MFASSHIKKKMQANILYKLTVKLTLDKPSKLTKTPITKTMVGCT